MASNYNDQIKHYSCSVKNLLQFSSFQIIWGQVRNLEYRRHLRSFGPVSSFSQWGARGWCRTKTSPQFLRTSYCWCQADSGWLDQNRTSGFDTPSANDYFGKPALNWGPVPVSSKGLMCTHPGVRAWSTFPSILLNWTGDSRALCDCGLWSGKCDSTDAELGSSW